MDLEFDVKTAISSHNMKAAMSSAWQIVNIMLDLNASSAAACSGQLLSCICHLLPALQ